MYDIFVAYPPVGWHCALSPLFDWLLLLRGDLIRIVRSNVSTYQSDRSTNPADNRRRTDYFTNSYLECEESMTNVEEQDIEIEFPEDDAEFDAWMSRALELFEQYKEVCGIPQEELD